MPAPVGWDPPVTGVSSRPVGPGPDRDALFDRFAGTGAVVLTGRWAGSAAGGVVVATDPIRTIENGDDPFGALSRRIDGAVGPVGSGDSATVNRTVGGGWFGWAAFSGGRSQWGYYPNVLRYDPVVGEWFDEALVGGLNRSELERRRGELVARLHAPQSWPGMDQGPPTGRFTASVTRSGYETAVEAAMAHIRAGDIYQVNVCLRLSAPLTGSPARVHSRLVRALEPAFGAYLEMAGTVVSSASPELFLRRRGRAVRSAPVKGTRPRPDDEAEAARQAAELRASAKERAENVMIVDMVRNDLARVAAVGTVRVPELLRVEAHPGVWHLVSDVTATLRAGVTDAELARATFPPGSVTGTPKVRAVELIAELEPLARGVYTGAIGFQSPVAGLELSVAIRTLEIGDGMVGLGVGAGITADSVPRQEWWECFDKAGPIVAALGASIEAADSVRPVRPLGN